MKKRVFVMVVMLIMLLGLLHTVALADGPAQRTTALDLTTQDTEDYIGTEGWAWDAGTKTLTLDGLDLSVASGHAIIVPDGTTIILAAGSVNNITAGANAYGISAPGDLTVKSADATNKGTLNITTPYRGIGNNELKDATKNHAFAFENIVLNISAARGINTVSSVATLSITLDGVDLTRTGTDRLIQTYNDAGDATLTINNSTITGDGILYTYASADGIMDISDSTVKVAQIKVGWYGYRFDLAQLNVSKSNLLLGPYSTTDGLIEVGINHATTANVDIENSEIITINTHAAGSAISVSQVPVGEQTVDTARGSLTMKNCTFLAMGTKDVTHLETQNSSDGNRITNIVASSALSVSDTSVALPVGTEINSGGGVYTVTGSPITITYDDTFGRETTGTIKIPASTTLTAGGTTTISSEGELTVEPGKDLTIPANKMTTVTTSNNTAVKLTPPSDVPLDIEQNGDILIPGGTQIQLGSQTPTTKITDVVLKADGTITAGESADGGYSWYSDENSEYTIDSIEELAAFAKITQGDVTLADGTTISKDDFKNKTVKLGADLTFTDNQYWYYNDGTTSYSYVIKDFAGTFDGQGHTITGLQFNAPASNSGLFGTVSGTVQNLTLKNVSANTSGVQYFGFLAGKLTGTAENCHVSGATITSSGQLQYTGALIGNAAGAGIDRCSAENVSATWTGTSKNAYYFGGLIGSAVNSTIKNSSITDVTFDCTYNTQNLGGFIGGSSNTSVTDCTATNVNIAVDNDYNTVGGFAGEPVASTYTRCKVIGFTVDADTTGRGRFLGGFCGWIQGASTCTDCSVTGLEIDAEVVSGGTAWIGGFSGAASGGGTFTASGCTVSGTITVTGAGRSDHFYGGFIGCSNNSLSATRCNVSNVTVNAENAEGYVGGFVGGLNSKPDLTATITNCTSASSVTGNDVIGGICGYVSNNAWTVQISGSTASPSVKSTNGVAGGLIGYMVAGEMKGTITKCTPSTNVNGKIKDRVANAPDKEYSISSEGDVSWEFTDPAPLCYGKLYGCDFGFASIQAAVDAGATTITLLQDISGETADFILNGVDHDAEKEKLKDFTLDLNGFTFNGTVHIYHSINHFTVSGAGEGSSTIKMTAPLGEHDVFNGWCNGSGAEGGAPGNDVSYATKSEDGLYWFLESGNTYHTHFTPSGYQEMPAADRHLNFGTMTYGGTAPEAKTFTFIYNGEGENVGIKGFEPNPYFTVSGIGSLTVTIRPNANLDAGTYNERIYVTMHDGSSHEIWAAVTVSSVPSQVDPVLDPDNGIPAAVTGIYGSNITLAVEVSRAQAKAKATLPGMDRVAFYYGETLLGEASVTYSDATTGTATLEYDTSLGGIPVADGSEITVVYGGGINLLESNGTIIVDLAPKELTVSGLTATNRVYDSTTAVAVTGGMLTGIVGEDAVAIDEITAGVETADSGEDKPVIISNITLTGADADKYVVNTYPTDLTVDISKATPTVTITADPASMTGSGTVTLTIGGIPATESVSVACDVDGIVPTDNSNGTWSVSLPNETKEYTFTVSYAGGTNYTAAADATCTVSVTRYTYTGPTMYAINVGHSENGSVVSGALANSAGSRVTLTVKPDEGYELGSLTVTDRAGNEIELIEIGDGKYTFEMPASRVTVEATFRIINPFSDVATTDWFYDEVMYVYENGLMQGTGGGKFSPNLTTSRGMIVTILYRLEGEPIVSGENPFTDLTQDWYVDAVKWAAANGIVDGYGDGKFGPEDAITREQLAAILWRYARYKGYDVSVGEDTNILSWPDAFDVSEYAVSAMQWVTGEGIVQGADGKLLPLDGTKRCEAAAMLMRFIEGCTK